MTQLKKIVAALGLAGLCAGPALADSISLPTGLILFEDDSAETIGNDPNGDKLLDVGDTLKGIFNVPQYKDAANALHPIGSTELTGIFEIEVATRTDLGGGLAAYTFKAYAPFEALYGTGAVVALFADATPDFCYNNMATCTPNASNGTFWMSLGFDGDPDVFWNAPSAPIDTTVPRAFNDTDPIGSFRYALNIIQNASGSQWGLVNLSCPGILNDPTCGGAGDDKVNARGSGNVLGTQNGQGGQTTDFSSTDDLDFRMNRIPEPGMLTLLGIGLAGLGAFARRRRSV